MISHSGEILHTSRYDKDGITPVLTCVMSTLQNYNSDVCVITIGKENEEDDDKKSKRKTVRFL